MCEILIGTTGTGTLGGKRKQKHKKSDNSEKYYEYKISRWKICAFRKKSILLQTYFCPIGQKIAS